MNSILILIIVILALSLFEFLPNTAVAGSANPEGMIVVGSDPSGITVNPATNKVYVINRVYLSIGYNNEVTVIDGSSNKIIDTIKISDQLPDPEVEVNPTTNRIYLSSRSDYYPSAFNFIVIDGSTHTIIDTLPVSGAFAINNIRNMIYLASPNGTFYVMDGSTNKVVTSLSLDLSPPVFGLQVAVNPDTNTVYLTAWTNEFRNSLTSLTVIDGLTNKVIATNVTSICPPKINPWGCEIAALTMNPDTNRLYVSSIQFGNPLSASPPLPRSAIKATLYVLDGSTYNALANFTLPYATGIAVNRDTNIVYVYSGYNNEVTVIDGSTHTIITTIMTTENNHRKDYFVAGRIAVNPNTNIIYVTNPPFNSVSVIDGATNKLISEFSELGVIILPPLQQIANGVLPENVTCKEGLQLIFKSKDNSPACVKPQTAEKLVQRGWGITMPHSEQKRIAMGSDWPSECGTAFEVTFSDPSKFNKSNIMNTFREKFSTIDVSEQSFRSDTWWEYIIIHEPGQDGISVIEIPGVFYESNSGYFTIVETLGNLESVSNVGVRGVGCH